MIRLLMRKFQCKTKQIEIKNREKKEGQKKRKS